MSIYQKTYLAYVKAIKRRNNAKTEDERKKAEIVCVIYRKWLDKNRKA